MRSSAFGVLLVACGAVLPLWSETYVKGYYRSNGTYVAPHYRRSSSAPAPAPIPAGLGRRPFFSPARSDGAAAGRDADERLRTKEHQDTEARFRRIEDAIRKFQESAYGKVPTSLEILRKSERDDLFLVDGWGTKFHYVPDVRDFALVSAGPDRVLRTADDIRCPMGKFVEPVAQGKVERTRERLDTDEGFRKIENAIRKYQETAYGKVPGSLETLLETGACDFPIADGWGTKFLYAAGVRDYALVSAGPDRVLRTEDDIRSPRSTLADSVPVEGSARK